VRGARWKAARGDVVALLSLLTFHLAAALALPLAGDVPLGDAAHYAWSARHWIETGELRISDWPAMSLVGQLWLALPLARVFGPGPAVLGGATFALAAITAVLLYALLRSRGADAFCAWLATSALGANPIWLAQSVTFDTEVYFLFFTLAGLLALARWELRRRPWQLGLACAAIAYAGLIRQHALVLSLGAGVLWWRTSRERRFPLWPWALPVAVLAGYYLWLSEVHGLSKEVTSRQAFLAERALRPWTAAWPLFSDLTASVHYLGLFLLPLLGLASGGQSGAAAGGARRNALAALALVALATLALALGSHPFSHERLMPYVPNIATLGAFVRPVASRLPEWVEPRRVQLVLTLVSGLAGAALLRRAGVAAAAWSNPFDALLLFSALLLVCFGALTGSVSFDRYFLVPFALLLPVLAPRLRLTRRGALVAGSLLALEAGLALTFVDQRIRVRRCPWELASGLVARGIPHRSIDAGFEFNTYYNYDYYSKRYGRELERPWEPRDAPEAEWVLSLVPRAEGPLELLEVHECPNRRGLDPIPLWVYAVRPPQEPGTPGRPGEGAGPAAGGAPRTPGRRRGPRAPRRSACAGPRRGATLGA